MLRPYLAIIKDSFRAAIASRVLVIMLVLIAVFLMVLAPFKIKDDVEWKVTLDHMDPTGPEPIVALLAENRDNDKRPRLKQVWKLLPKKSQDKLIKYSDYHQELEEGGQEKDSMEMGRFGLYTDLVEGLNHVLESDEFYDPEVWPTNQIVSTEARDLIDYGVDKLDDIQMKRLNRVLLSQAVGNKIRPPSTSSVQFGYAIWDWGNISGGRVVLHNQIASTLPWILDKFVLSIGLLISILVTASIMPSMFEAGSLTLLMSKPIYRWALYISKFVGACAFAGLLSTFLFVGLWLVLGARVGYWDRSLLLSIPIYIFVFAVYYSVSAFLGMFFRNTIVSIIGTILFWAFCFGIGVGHQSFDKFIYYNQPVAVASGGESMIQVDRVGIPHTWSESERTWRPFLVSKESSDAAMGFRGSMAILPAPKLPLPRTGAPLYNKEYDVWMSVAQGLVDIQALRSGSSIRCAKPNEFGDPKIVRNTPPNATALFNNSRGKTILITGDGDFYEIIADPIEVANQNKDELPAFSEPKTIDVKSGSGTNIKLKNSNPSKSGQKPENKTVSESDPKAESAEQDSDQPKLKLTRALGPDLPVTVGTFHGVALNKSTDEIAVYNARNVYVYKRIGDSEYKQDRQVPLEVEFDASMTAWIEFAGDTIFLAFGNGEVYTIESQSGEMKKLYQPESRSAIYAVDGSPDGRFLAVTYRNGSVWLLDMEKPEKMIRPRIKNQGQLTNAQFDDSNQMLVSNRHRKVYWVDPTSLKAADELAPKATTIEKVYYYGVRPAYLLCPKPGEFYKLVEHLSGSKQANVNKSLDLTESPEPERPWEPIQNGIAFVLTMLLLSCVIFSRTDY